MTRFHEMLLQGIVLQGRLEHFGYAALFQAVVRSMIMGQQSTCLLCQLRGETCT